MIDKEMAKNEVIRLEEGLKLLDERIAKLRKDRKETKRRLRDARILFWQAGGENENNSAR